MYANPLGFINAFIVIAFFLAVVVLLAWIAAIGIFVDSARAKGRSNTGILWFIGLFASPIVLGLLVCAMPDKQAVPSEPNDLPTV